MRVSVNAFSVDRIGELASLGDAMLREDWINMPATVETQHSGSEDLGRVKAGLAEIVTFVIENAGLIGPAIAFVFDFLGKRFEDGNLKLVHRDGDKSFEIDGQVSDVMQAYSVFLKENSPSQSADLGLEVSSNDQTQG